MIKKISLLCHTAQFNIRTATMLFDCHYYYWITSIALILFDDLNCPHPPNKQTPTDKAR